MIDWLRLLRQHRVQYRTDGPNCAKGHVVVKCPFCGSADKSEHMGIELVTGKWGCWRSKAHRGRSPIRLLMRLFNLSYGEAQEIAGGQRGLGDETVVDAIARTFGTIKPFELKESVRQSVDWCGSKPFPKTEPFVVSATRFFDYLARRGFKDPKDVAQLYELRYATSGFLAWRVILPVYADRKLIGLVGRSIGETRDRYLTYPPKSDLKRVVYGFDELIDGGDILLVVEGPFDMLKLDYYACEGVRATCTFGTAFTDDQIEMLAVLGDGFKHMIMLFDDGALAEAMRCREALADLDSLVMTVPFGASDPGALTSDQVVSFTKRLHAALV